MVLLATTDESQLTPDRADPRSTRLHTTKHGATLRPSHPPFFFFLNDPAPPELYPLPPHTPLPLGPPPAPPLSAGRAEPCARSPPGGPCWARCPNRCPPRRAWAPCR